MDDSDLFSDEPVVTQARAGAKFLPKAKRKAKDETSGSMPSKFSDVLKEEAAKAASTGLDSVQVVQPDCAVDDSWSSQVINGSQVAAADSLLAEVVTPNCCDDTNSAFGRSVGENANLFFGLECLDQFLTQSSNNDGIGLDYERTAAQEAGSFPDVETQDILSNVNIACGQRAGKFKLKPRLQTSLVSSEPAMDESVIHSPNSQFLPSETMSGEGSIPDFPCDEVPYCSPLNLGAFIPPDPSTSERPVNEEQANLTEASDLKVTLSSDVSAMPREVSYNISQGKASPILNPSQKSKQSSNGEEVIGNGKETKKVTTPQIIDDPEEGTYNDDGLAAELPNSSSIEEGKDDVDGNDDDDEYNMESSFPKRRTSRRSKKAMTENEKPPRKCKITDEAQMHKKSNEASDRQAKEQPKKFSRSTRKKRRFEDESLLHTPEDEIDFAKVALKDIILFADHKERLAKKEAKTSKMPLNNQSTKKTFREENAHDEEGSIASEQEQGFTDDQVSSRAQSSSFCLNYQSYMKKEPRARWSKQDTELFYGAIRQFGPDFSLIQQLFPGRSRHQIKLKFKNEERRSPFKLSEALASRANDHSYFEKVIEQFQQVSGPEHESHVDSACKEGKLSPETHGEAAKAEQDENLAVGDQEDVTEDHSTLKSDETDDDHEILSSYRSAF